MSTNRNISTLPLDALRSGTHQISDRHRSGNSDQSFSKSINDLNLRLCKENQKLRRCLSLFLENSSLQTASVLSSIMSLCDDKLRSFITEKLIYEPTNATDEGLGGNVKSSRQSGQACDVPNDTLFSYGMSFQNIDLDDLCNDTFESYEKNSTRSPSPRRSHSTASQAWSLRPPMRFGVGKSPYTKSPIRSPIARLYPPSTKTKQEHVQQISQSKQKSKSSKKDKSTNHSYLNKVPDAIYETDSSKRSRSAPLVRKIVLDNEKFRASKSNAFSHVKQQCKECSMQASDLCSIHSSGPGKYIPTASVGRSPTEESLPVRINATPQLKTLKLDQTSTSIYKTAPPLLYDSHSQNYDGLYSEKQVNLSRVSPSSDKKMKRHLSKLIEWPQESNEYQSTENVKDSLDNSEVTNDYNSPDNRSSFVNNSTDADLTPSKLYAENVRGNKTLVSEPHLTNDGFVQHGTQTQLPPKSFDLDKVNGIGSPQAASTPVARQSQKDKHIFQRQGSVLSDEALAHVMGMRGQGVSEKELSNSRFLTHFTVRSVTESLMNSRIMISI